MNINIRLEEDVAIMLSDFSEKNKKTKVSIVNDAIRSYIQNESYKQRMLETLSKSPEAVAQLLKILSSEK